MTVAATSIDPRLIAMVGRKLYSSNPLPIVVRELLQNSIDACKRKGVEPDIRIEIRELDNWHDWVVVCEDNGIGMTAEQIVTDFLRLGGRKEESEGQTGGFGIAKAAIMSCADWRVRTLDNYLDRNVLENGGNIQKRKKSLAGTRITLRIKETIYDSAVRNAILMVYLSDVCVHLKVRKTDYQSIRLNDPVAGLNIAGHKILHKGDNFDLWGFEDIHLPVYKGDLEVKKLGWIFIRLNGLMQFTYGSRMDARKNNLVFDIITSATPEDKNYPFSLSREKLEAGYDEAVNALVQSHNANVMQSMVALKEQVPETETAEVITGRMLHGKRTTKYRESKRAYDEGMGNLTQTELSLEERVQQFQNRSKAPVQLLIHRYEKDPAKRSWHAKLLLVWQDVLQVACELEEEFGIGITSSQYNTAVRMDVDYTIYYVLNPELAMRNLKNASDDAIVIALWTLACHEATHKYVTDHNEAFTTTEGDIMRDTSDMILRVLPEITRRLK